MAVPIIELLNHADGEAMLFLNSFNHSSLDQLMYALSGRFTWMPFYIFLFVLIVRRFGWRKAVFSLLLIALTILLADKLCNNLLRPMIGRLRPACLDNPLSRWIYIVNEYRGGRNGFPSCHAANSFALAVYLTRTMRWRGYAMAAILVWAAFIAYTRIYLGVHYPGDVIVGGLIGSAIACGTSTLFLRRDALRAIAVKAWTALPRPWRRTRA